MAKEIGMSKKTKKAINKAFNELYNMSNEELLEEMEKHKDGPLHAMLEEFDTDHECFIPTNKKRLPILTTQEAELALIDCAMEKEGLDIEKINSKIKEIISRSAEVEIERVTLKKKLKENFRMDLQKRIDLVCRVKLGNNTLNDDAFETVEDVYLYVKKKILNLSIA